VGQLDLTHRSGGLAECALRVRRRSPPPAYRRATRPAESVRQNAPLVGGNYRSALDICR
jgi:hypothetical protein